MATTTNYGWETPDDTDLVKDGASAIRTLGSSIDTTTKALNPSTTLGDIEYRSSTANTNTRLAIGTAGQVLTVSGGVPAWTTFTTSGPTFSAKSNADQSVSSSTNTKATLQVENWDTASNFASSTFTPTTAGYYQINAMISFEGAATKTYRTIIYKNGSAWENGQMSIGVAVANPAVTVSSLVYLNGSTDYIELYGWTDAATPKFYRSYLDGIWIRS